MRLSAVSPCGCMVTDSQNAIEQKEKGRSDDRPSLFVGESITSYTLYRGRSYISGHTSKDRYTHTSEGEDRLPV